MKESGENREDVQMNIQFETAYNIFKDFYGEPKWMIDPKEGQNPDVIIEQWCNELQPYSVEQIRQACSWLTRKRRVMTFPMLDSLLAELSDKEPVQKKEINKGEEALMCYNHMLKNASSCNPPVSKLAAQRVIWNIYGLSMDGYVPE